MKPNAKKIKLNLQHLQNTKAEQGKIVSNPKWEDLISSYICLIERKRIKSCSSYSLCFTRLPFTSLPSSMASFPCLQTTTECSLTLATYSKSSVNSEGQLSFKYSNPSVCITAAKTMIQNRFQHHIGKR